MKRLCFFLLAIFLTACERRPSPPPEFKGKAIAKIADRMILDSELLEHVEVVERETPQRLSTHNQKRQLLEQLINIELLYREALRMRFDESYVFKARLAEAFVEKLAQEAASKISEEVLERHYRANRREFDQVAARHILLRTDSQSPEEERRAKFEKAKELHARLLREPQNFQELAREHSEDGSRAQGGDLGYFVYAQMVPEFSKAAFELKQINAISPVVQTRFGYHIIQLAGDRRGIEFHRERIYADLVERSRQRLFEENVQRLRSEADIQITKITSEAYRHFQTSF